MYKYTVNGVKFEKEFRELVALDIVEIAKKANVPFPSDNLEYVKLESVGVNKKMFDNEDRVDLTKYKKFIIILDKPAPVA